MIAGTDLDMQQKAYGEILQWLEKQRSQQEQRLLPSPISDRAIQQFLWKGSNLPYHQLAALRGATGKLMPVAAERSN